MTKISLRDYNREIETLIERGEGEEAIAHCKYILKTYPKHLDTYRLLGKAFLESQRYSEAADILQRILSVHLDDFVSQIGMSIIREDEGNLDAAIYHMERAFEIQPSNAAVHDELRRLYGRRDGVEPPRLRLTRGALVRMYARGDLHRQAIAEARAALAEDAQRWDLNIILARMYYTLGQKVEAADLCSRTIARLPYCFEANRILSEILPETSRAEDAKTYTQRMQAIDPYLAYVPANYASLSQVPDQAVTLDRLEWTPGLDVSQQPTWAADLGVSLGTPAQEENIDWLSANVPANFAVNPADEQPTAAEPVISTEPSPSAAGSSGQDIAQVNFDTEELPEWMKTAGWAVPENPTEEQAEPVSFEQASFVEEETQALPAEMPDWLRNMAPDSNAEAPASSDEDQSRLDWLSSILPGESTEAVQTISPSAEVEPSSTSTPPSELPALEAEFPVNQELPDWLRSAPILAEDETSDLSVSSEPLPEWLTEPSEIQEMPTEETQVGQVPLQADMPQETAQTQPADQYPPDAPILQSETALQEPAASEPASMPDLNNMDAAMAWLESLAAKQGAEEESLITRPEDRIEQPPAWVTDTPNEVIEPAPAEEIIKAEVESEQPAEKTQPVAVSAQAAESEVSMTPPQAALEEAEPGLPPQENVIEPLADAVAQAPEDTVEVESAPLPAAEPTADLSNMDAAFAWLEALAAKQGADEETLLVAPENRTEQPPDWAVTPASTETVPAQEEPAAPPETPSMQTAEWAPDWMKQGEENPPSEPDQNLSQQQMPDWLVALEKTQDETDTSSPVVASGVPELVEQVASQPPTADEQTTSPDWIKISEESEAVQPAAEATQELPSEPSEQISPEQPAQAPTWPVGFGKTGPLPGWLLGGTETTHAAADQAEEPDLPVPDWLKSEIPSTPSEAQPQPTESTGAEAPPLPEWLKNIEEEKVEVPIPHAIPDASTPAPEPIALSEDPAVLVDQAQAALNAGHIDQALDAYNSLIQKDQFVEKIIHDLRDALYRFPVESSIWQTLGDAYIRVNHIQDALDAYTKAEELLR